MQQKYDWLNRILDETIKEQFAKSDEIIFLARGFNHIQTRSISFGNLGWWIPLTRAFSLIGVTPQMLRPVFNPRLVMEKKVERIRIKRSFPLNIMEAIGLLQKKYENRIKHQLKEVEQAETIETYEELGDFPLSEKPFKELARILGKSVKVLQEDDGTGEHFFLFSVYPSGIIVLSE